MSSANKLCKQFGSRSGSTNQFEANLFEKIVFLKEIYKVDLKILVKRQNHKEFASFAYNAVNTIVFYLNLMKSGPVRC